MKTRSAALGWVERLCGGRLGVEEEVHGGEWVRPVVFGFGLLLMVGGLELKAFEV